MFFTIITIVAVVSLMIFFNALYVAAEFATVSARKTRISQLAGQGNRMAQQLLPIMENGKELDIYIATCQIGITLSSLVVGIYGQSRIASLLVSPFTNLITGLADGGWFEYTEELAVGAAETISFVLVLVILTGLQVVLGELLPKSIAIQYPEQLALAVVVPMRISKGLLKYVIAFFNNSGNLVLRLMGQQTMKDKHTNVHSPEEIEMLVTESHEGGLLEDSERRLLRNAFRLRDLTAKQVMLHRTKLIAAPVDFTVQEIINIALESGLSRIPIYEESIDNIIGFVHVKDLFRLYLEGETSSHSIIREVVYVPETLPVVDVWERLNSRGKYLAIVFDEYGGTEGLITFEDLIEEVFGELQDEFDEEMALIARDKDGRLYLRGDLLVADVNEYLDLKLPTEADTLSGLIFSELGGVPSEGDVLKVGDTVMRVESMEGLGVSEISLKLPVTDGEELFTGWEVADHE